MAVTKLIDEPLGFFVWAVRSGQLENLDQEGMRILFDDDATPAERRGGPHAEETPPEPPEAS